MKLIVAAMALTMSTRAFANYWPTGMKAIDANLSSKSGLAPADMSQLKALRVDRGETPQGRQARRSNEGAGRDQETARQLIVMPAFDVAGPTGP